MRLKKYIRAKSHPLGIGFRGVSGEVAHPQPPMGRQPLFPLLTGLGWGLINPQADLAARTGRQHLLQPAERRVRVLPVNDKRGHFCPRPQMHCPINVLGGCAACPIGNQRLLPHRVPAPGHRPFHVHFALIVRPGGNVHWARRQLRQRGGGLPLKAGLLGGTALEIEFAPALRTPGAPP